MAGLSVTLETGRTTLLNTQIQLQTASNNIANADNENYARQKVVMGSNVSLFGMGGYIGTGASVLRVTQERDQLIERRLLQSISGEAGQTTLADQLSSVQDILSDDGSTGLSSLLGDFWDSWDSLSQNAGGTSEQKTVLSVTDSLADSIRSIYGQLQTVAEDDLPESIADDTESINNLLSRIADYNTQILKAEGSDYTANSLRDGRYAAVKELAELIPAQYSENEDGTITVTMSYGDSSSATLVEGKQAGTVAYDSSTQGLSVTQADGSTVAVAADDMTDGSLGGKMAALGKVNEYMSSLDDFAVGLMTAVNNTHGTAVFSGTGASDIASTGTFLDSVDVSTESALAVSISALQDEDVTIGSGSDQLGEYLSSLQSQVGTDQSSASDSADIQTALREALEEQQQSVSGVSLDEEMVDIIKFQQVYQAAAKLIQTTSEMIQTAIDMV